VWNYQRETGEAGTGSSERASNHASASVRASSGAAMMSAMTSAYWIATVCSVPVCVVFMRDLTPAEPESSLAVTRKVQVVWHVACYARAHGPLGHRLKEK